jgi:hypothetical protein
MRTLSWDDIDDILAGATILGCGGGGELAEGREYMQRAYDAGHSVRLAAPDELPAEALVACPYGVGAMTVGDEAVYGGRPFADEHPGVLAVRALAEHLGCEFAALICGELGGTSIADAFYPAAMLGLPIVDADPVGRAVPELEHSLFYVHGVPIAPQAVVNEIGDTALITRVGDDLRAEALVRALSVASRNLVWVADHARPWGELRKAAVLGSISASLAVGAAWRQAIAAGADMPCTVAAAAHGVVVFRGEIVSHVSADVGGFTVGDTHLAGCGGDEGAAYRIWFKNENLMAWRDDVPDVTCPDLICVFDEATGAVVTNPFATVGARVAVVGMPAPSQWRTAKGIATLGPRHFGFDVEFVAVEEQPRSSPGRR